MPRSELRTRLTSAKCDAGRAGDKRFVECSDALRSGGMAEQPGRGDHHAGGALLE